MNEQSWSKRYRWVRTWAGETGIDGKPHEDYSAYDGEEYAGRIFFEPHGPTKGLWRWAGSCPRPMFGSPIVPNAGYRKSAASAAKAVEDYWDASKTLRDQRVIEQKKSPAA